MKIQYCISSLCAVLLAITHIAHNMPPREQPCEVIHPITIAVSLAPSLYLYVHVVQIC